MEIEIRKAKKEDIKLIVELNKKLGDYHRTIDTYYSNPEETASIFEKDLVKALEDSKKAVFIAETGSTVVGYILGEIEKNPFVAPKKIGKINEAFVEEDYRKQGAGGKMLRKLLNWFEDNEIKNIELSVDARNDLGIKLWRKFGFTDFRKKMRLDLDNKSPLPL